MEGEDYVVKSDSYIRATSESSSALHPYDYRWKLLNVLDGSSFKTVGQKVIYGFQVETAGVYTVGFRYSQNYKEDLPVYADLCVDGEVLFSEMNSTVVITAHMMQAIYDSADSHREIML